MVSNTFRTFLNKLISNLHYVPRNLSVLGPNGRLHLPEDTEDTTLHQSEHRIAIPHSKSTQYTLSIACLYHFARSGCSVSDCFAAQIFFYLPFISPFEPGKEFLIEFAHGRSRLAANQTVIDVVET